MRYEDSPVKAPPPPRRSMAPPTPLQNPYSSFEGSSRGTTRWKTRFGGRVRKRRGVQIRLLHRMKDSGKWAGRAACCVELIGNKGAESSGELPAKQC